MDVVKNKQQKSDCITGICCINQTEVPILRDGIFPDCTPNRNEVFIYMREDSRLYYMDSLHVERVIEGEGITKLQAGDNIELETLPDGTIVIKANVPDPFLVINSLDSESIIDALSAKQGKILQEGKSDINHTHLYAGSKTEGGAANSVEHDLLITLNGGFVENYDRVQFNGSSDKSIDITPAKIGTLTSSEITTALNGKQPTLISGVNLKTLNSLSLLGSGNLITSVERRIALVMERLEALVPIGEKMMIYKATGKNILSIEVKPNTDTITTWTNVPLNQNINIDISSHLNYDTLVRIQRASIDLISTVYLFTRVTE